MDDGSSDASKISRDGDIGKSDTRPADADADPEPDAAPGDTEEEGVGDGDRRRGVLGDCRGTYRYDRWRVVSGLVGRFRLWDRTHGFDAAPDEELVNVDGINPGPVP